ncbi:PEPxxWA-CTERM sorting domain-containing protein [Polymorphobacter sp. PAMC 29334]|uniref:PEPxxWA-CTERM sorting domain-containing protein n=1 Tax=Polymorphobacter sp. PAMC 29334 TaxID=2862331 RepID=UPI001D01766D|nr:PEPxxWA-CTERM sorting domain-containing protein [Polymorphobacter sp. PAMC 29334]
MKLILTAVISALAGFAALPANAVTYDANASFTATSATTGPFTFGSFSGGVFTAYPTGGTCLFANTTCLTAGDYLGVYQSSDGAAHQSGTALIPATGLVLHPGAADQLSVIMFTAPKTAIYTIKLAAYQADVDARTQTVGLVSGTSTYTVTTLSPSNPSLSISGKALLTAGQQVGVFVGNDGQYFFDATGVGFSASVPEPASWVLMITGFGMVGFAARRRTTAVTA